MTNIAEVKFEPDPELIQRVEQLLDRVRNGEIIAVAYTGLTQDRAVATGWFKPQDQRFTALIGAVSFLEFRMNKFQDE